MRPRHRARPNRCLAIRHREPVRNRALHLSRLLRAVMDYFPALGPALNRAAGATTTMQKIIELRETEPHPSV